MMFVLQMLEHSSSICLLLLCIVDQQWSNLFIFIHPLAPTSSLIILSVSCLVWAAPENIVAKCLKKNSYDFYCSVSSCCIVENIHDDDDAMQWKLFFRVNHCYDMTDIASLEFSHASFLRVIFWCLNSASFNPIYENLCTFSWKHVPRTVCINVQNAHDDNVQKTPPHVILFMICKDGGNLLRVWIGQPQLFWASNFLSVGQTSLPGCVMMNIVQTMKCNHRAVLRWPIRLWSRNKV